MDDAARGSGPLDDAPDDVLDRARLKLRAEYIENQAEEQGRRLARRIFVSFLLVAGVSVVFFVVLPVMGIRLPPIVPILCCATILVGAVMSFASDTDAKRQEAGLDGAASKEEACDPNDDDPGRPVGCCPGPRPLRMFRRDGR